MRLTRKVYATGGQKALDFAIGFVGWFLLNGALYGILFFFFGQILSDRGGGLAALLLALPLLINVGALVLLGFTRYWIALGALAAFALSLLGVLVAALLVYAVCFSDGTFQ
jgi:hypothetical protein